MQKRVFLLVMVMLLFYSAAWSQTKTVSGTVYDEGGDPLLGVSIIVKGSQQTKLIGTVTNFDGNYNLIVNDSDVLVFSFLGFETKEVEVQGLDNFDVNLKSSMALLDDVVVVGYGVQKKASAVGAISQAKGEDLLKVGSVTAITDALQGMMPGVTSISSGTGQPGADAGTIFIRGKASWQDNDPLVLVDGVERDMDDVDPNEIQTVSVLKDASATAVFGVKGGNGVILITTKRGTISKPKVSFSANFGVKQPMFETDYTDYVTSMEMWNEACANDGLWDQMISESEIAAWQNAYDNGMVSSTSETYPEVDWADEVFKDFGFQQQYNVNVRGGTNFMKYFASLGYLNDGDVYDGVEHEDYDPEYSYQRYNWRVNLDLNLTKTTVFSTNLAGKLGYRHEPGDYYSSESFYSMLYSSARNLYPVTWEDGTYAVNSSGGGNPVYELNEGGEEEYKTFQGMLDFKLDQKLDFITKGLKFTGSFSYSSYSAYSSYVRSVRDGIDANAGTANYYRAYDYTDLDEDGYPTLIDEATWPNEEYEETPLNTDYDTNTGYNKRIYYEMAFNYVRSFGDHDVTGLGLFSRREKKTKSYSVPYRQEDWVARVTYGYKDRYFVDVNGSYNGSEAFAPGLRFGLFYSGSVGWRISEEPFVKSFAKDWLNNFKVRYSYGTSGVDGDDRFLYQQSYSTSSVTNSAKGVWLGDTQSVNYSSISTEGDAANDEATWETSIKNNLGLEFGFINKITGAIDLYNEKREDILMDVWAPLWYLSTGSSATGNVGETKNHGMEVELKWADGIGNDLKYWVGGNFSLNENRIVYKADGVNEEEHLQDAGKPIGWTTAYINNDLYSSLDDIYNYATTTTDQSMFVAGDMMYVDYDGDGEITSADKVVTEDVKYPLNTYSISMGASYKGWACHFTFYGVSDVSKLLPTSVQYSNLNGSSGIYVSNSNVTDRWTTETASTATASSLHTGTYDDYNMYASTYRYTDASYWRLKNAEVSYSFKKPVLDRLRMSKLQLYVNGNNLITFTDLDKLLDPEATSLSVYPMTKRYNVGLRASF
jgi:TonB-linked SusC/RagA family outer membrane protein